MKPSPNGANAYHTDGHRKAFDVLRPDWRQVEQARQTVLAALMERGIDPSTVCFAGYSPRQAKPQDGEFAVGDECAQYFFGTAESLAPPGPGADEEETGDRWAANPLQYAMGPGQVLGVYDTAKLERHMIESDPEYGTHLVEATADQVAQALLLTLLGE